MNGRRDEEREGKRKTQCYLDTSSNSSSRSRFLNDETVKDNKPRVTHSRVLLNKLNDPLYNLVVSLQTHPQTL